MNDPIRFRLLLCLLPAAMALLLPSALGQGESGHGDGGTPTGPAAPEGTPVTMLEPFVDPLPIPANAAPVGRLDGAPLYEIRMEATKQKLHRDLPEMEVWGYGADPNSPVTYPGPTIQAVTNTPIYVRWINALPTTYPPWLPVHTHNHGAMEGEVHNVVHLHGGANRPAYDGHPTNWFRPGDSRLYYYENIDFGGDGETLWYHDHAIGVTANNVYAGLAGFYLLRNPALEQELCLPSGPFEIPLVFQDRDVQTNLPVPSLLWDPRGSLMVAWFNLPVVNGKVMPYLNVEPRKYRFRILNGSLFRTIGLKLVRGNTDIPIHQIGTDDGFLPRPVPIPGERSGPRAGPPTLRLMPGERADVVVDFSAWAGARDLVFTNSFESNSVALPPDEPKSVVGGRFMQFRVAPFVSVPDTSKLPEVLDPAPTKATNLAAQAVLTRSIALDLRDESPYPGLAFDRDTNVFALLNLMHFDEPVTETPRGGDVEIWEFINLSPIAHPMHVHLLDFFVLNRQKFANTNSDPTLTPSGVVQYIAARQQGPPGPVSGYLSTNLTALQVNELGAKDVVHAAPWAVTRIVMRWPRYDDNRFVGPYVYHCHILDHEDNDMMRPIEVLPPLTPGQTAMAPDLLLGGYSVQAGTAAGVSYRLEGTADLREWFPIQPFAGTGQTFYLQPPVISDLSRRFFRARQLP